jgi:hypothetical protein
LIGGCTGDVLLLIDDDVACSVIVAINRAYSTRGQRQTLDELPRHERKQLSFRQPRQRH